MVETRHQVIRWNDLSVELQTSIAHRLAMRRLIQLRENGKHRLQREKYEEIKEAIMSHLKNFNDIVAEIDVQEIGEEAGIIE